MHFQKSKGQKSGVKNSAKFIHGHEENPKLGQASDRVLGNFRNSVEFRAKF